MTRGTDEAGGADIPAQGDTYTGPTAAVQHGDHNQQTN
jgi:hypothetical protein